jgi:twitching motility protein PilJ
MDFPMTHAQVESSSSLAAFSVSPSEQKQHPTSAHQRLSTRVQTFIRSNLVGTITASVTVSLVLFGASAWNVWTLYRGYKDAIDTQFQLKDLSGSIVHLDEVLTMSARMAASTGDLKWEKRYRHFEPILDQAIQETTRLVPGIVKAQSAKTDAANAKLIAFEDQAFKLVRQGRKPEALQLLLSTQYDVQKKIYADGVRNVITSIKAEIEAQLSNYRDRLYWSSIFTIVGLAILVLGWLIILSLIRLYFRERQQTQEALLVSQQSLQALNEELAVKAVQLKDQEQLTKQENDVLQTDVGRILDVVLALEEGDLTVQAPISDRATGLVADTLNRLIEELSRVMSVTLSTAQQVTQGADNLEHLSVNVAQQTQQQSQSVVEVKALVENISNLTQDTAKQALVADESVQRAQLAVSQGRQEMGTMIQDIAVLQQGTDQILKRIQSLNDFVELASQFTRDQKRVSALTRVLALNASMIAARASGQQDPEQFASVVHEFETIATQVNDLAVQTNQGLLLLQQRTDQIQTAVSGINQDAQDISGLVNQLTSSVNESRQVFENIQSVTERVAQVEQQVTQSSQDIATFVQGILLSVQDIATVSAETERQSQFTREQAGAMGQLSRTLLSRISFFRLSSH